MCRAGSIIIILLYLIIPQLLLAQDADKEVYRAVIDEHGIQRVSITGGEYYFDPEHIVVKVDIPVELTIRKDPSIVPHNIVINVPEGGMAIRESLSRDPKVIVFTPTKVGKFPFVCDKKILFFRSHDKRGMKGIIEVVE
jgi:plastocyanin domain-containing protein